MTTKSPDELSKTYYEAIGRVVVAFQSLEESITFALIRLTRSSIGDDIDLPYVFALSELPFKARLKLLRNFTERINVDHFMYSGCPSEKDRPAFFNDLIRRIKEASTDCESFEDKRNQFLHSVWRPSESDPDRTARRFKLRVQAKRVALANEEVPLSELQDLISKMISTESLLSTCSEILSSALIEKRENGS